MVVVGRVLRWFWRRPIATVASLAWLTVWTFLGAVWAGVLVALVAVCLVAWRLRWPASFAHWVAEPWGRRRRRCWYRQHWHELMTGHGLHRRRWHEAPDVHLMTVEPAGRVDVARLGRIRCGQWSDRLTVRPLVGQTLEVWEAATDGLTLASGARACRVMLAKRSGWLTVEFCWGDPLAAVVPALPVAADVDLRAVPVGMCEDGSVWTLALADNHILIAGSSGGGKSSVMWSALRGVSQLIADGLVVVYAVDPKGGMELKPGRALFARYADNSVEAMADLLDDAVTEMQDRARRYAGQTRTHQPSVGEPLIVVLIDELAKLIAYVQDCKLRERITKSVCQLLTMGRAVGVCVIAAVQDPHKDVVSFRGLFRTTIGLRLREATEVDMALGDGARRCGARCDRIPKSAPGVAYVETDGTGEWTRVRSAYITDADIAVMTETAKPTPALRLLDAPDVA